MQTTTVTFNRGSHGPESSCHEVHPVESHLRLERGGPANQRLDLGARPLQGKLLRSQRT